MVQLWRTEVVIYTRFDPSRMELNDLSEEATGGLAYCNSQTVTTVDGADVSASTRDFFNLGGDDEG